MGTPLAYLRRSRVFADKPGAVSYETQTNAVRALAARLGYELRAEQILEDWGKSGGEGRERFRLAYGTLRKAIEAGNVTDILAYDQSRLTRSTIEWANLAASCREHHVKVHLVNGGTKDFESADGRMTANILADIATAERERAQERAVQTVAYRRHRGDRLGPPAYGWRKVGGKGNEGKSESDPDDDVAAVVAAFTEAGSYNGAARLLNARGVASKRAERVDPRTGKPSIWRAAVVRRVIGREARGLIPNNARQGAKTRQDSRLAGLLVCACGGILTPSRRPRRSVVNYRCQRAYTAAAHPRPYCVSERAALPWVRAEVEHLRLPVDAVQLGREAGAERAELVTQRERLALGYARGGLTQATYETEDGALVARLAELGDTEEAAAVSPILPEEWDTWTPADLDRYMRSILERVDLGTDMRPVSATWRNPALRRACGDPTCTHCTALRSA